MTANGRQESLDKNKTNLLGYKCTVQLANTMNCDPQMNILWHAAEKKYLMSKVVVTLSNS
jgi:hypothetical protein